MRWPRHPIVGGPREHHKCRSGRTALAIWSEVYGQLAHQARTHMICWACGPFFTTTYLSKKMLPCTFGLKRGAGDLSRSGDPGPGGRGQHRLSAGARLAGRPRLQLVMSSGNLLCLCTGLLFGTLECLLSYGTCFVRSWGASCRILYMTSLGHRRLQQRYSAASSVPIPRCWGKLEGCFVWSSCAKLISAK